MTLNRMLRYFDINADIRPRLPAQRGVDGKTLHWLPQWLVLIAGVWIEPSFSAYRTTGVWKFDMSLGWMAFAVITAFLIFPGVYRKAFDESQPLIVLLPPIFTAGLGWHTLLGTVIKTVAAGSGG